MIDRFSDAVVETESVEAMKDVDSKLELPDDSGDRVYKSELPDDSGEKMPEISRELSLSEKQTVIKETGWSNEIVDTIGSMEEYGIYKQAELVEAGIGEKKCLIRSDIDMDQKDEFGRTNIERMADGKPPITKGGETVELHHIGQKQGSPLVELTTQEHRGKGNDTILHNKQKESEIDRIAFSHERQVHWETRSNYNPS